MVGLPIALVGMALVVTSFNIGQLLAAAQAADVREVGIQMGSAQVEFGAATLLGFLFFVLGVAIVNTGVAVRLFGRAPNT